MLPLAAAALVAAACVPPPAPAPTPPAPVPTTTAPPTTAPPSFPQLCSETGDTPADALLDSSGAAHQHSSIGDPVEPTRPIAAAQLPSGEPLVEVLERAAVLLERATPSADHAAPTHVLALSSLLDGRPHIDHVISDDAADALVQVEASASAVLAVGGTLLGIEDDPVLLAPAGATADTAEGYPVDDTYRDEQWAFDRFDFEDTWCASTGSGVTVAVIDNGIDADHPDLAGKVVESVDKSLDPHLYPDSADEPGTHGTHVAGTIAAIPNNDMGVAGVAPGVELIDVKALTAAQGAGTAGFTAAAIVYAVDRGADVANLSVGFKCDPTDDNEYIQEDATVEPCGFGNGYLALDLAVKYAQANDVLLVVAAGNDGAAEIQVGADEFEPNALRNVWSMPGAMDWSLTVGSMAEGSTMSEFSTQASYVDVSGPGSAILSTWFDDEGATYEESSGTSMATPHVAGLSAVLRGAFPNETAAQVKDRIISAVGPISNGDDADDSDGCPLGTPKAHCFGAGVIDPGASVQLGRV